MSVVSDEPANAQGDGNTSSDASISGELTALVRAERSGGFSGRTYTLTVECTDSTGIVVTDHAFVRVPHDRRK